MHTRVAAAAAAAAVAQATQTGAVSPATAAAIAKATASAVESAMNKSTVTKAMNAASSALNQHHGRHANDANNNSNNNSNANSNDNATATANANANANVRLNTNNATKKRTTHSSNIASEVTRMQPNPERLHSRVEDEVRAAQMRIRQKLDQREAARKSAAEKKSNATTRTKLRLNMNDIQHSLPVTYQTPKEQLRQTQERTITPDTLNDSNESAQSNISALLSPSVQTAAKQSGLRRKISTAANSPSKAKIGGATTATARAATTTTAGTSSASTSEIEENKVKVEENGEMDEEKGSKKDFSSGSNVRIVGLVAAAQHNGKVGVIKSFDSVRQRYIVQLLRQADSSQGDTQKLAVREVNIVKIRNIIEKQHQSAEATTNNNNIKSDNVATAKSSETFTSKPSVVLRGSHNAESPPPQQKSHVTESAPTVSPHRAARMTRSWSSPTTSSSARSTSYYSYSPKHSQRYSPKPSSRVSSSNRYQFASRGRNDLHFESKIASGKKAGRGQKKKKKTRVVRRVAETKRR